MQDEFRKIEDKLDNVSEKVDKLSDRINDVEKVTTELHATSAERLKQNERMFDEIVNVREAQQTTNSKLQEYNMQLAIHIAGVQELKKANELLQVKIEQEKEEINKRLDIAELPIKWAQTTGKIAKWIVGVSAGIAAAGGILKFLISL